MTNHASARLRPADGPQLPKPAVDDDAEFEAAP